MTHEGSVSCLKDQTMVCIHCDECGKIIGGASADDWREEIEFVCFACLGKKGRVA